MKTMKDMFNRSMSITDDNDHSDVSIAKKKIVKNKIKISRKIIGFENIDNVSCYANSVIQALYHCDKLVSAIHKGQVGEKLKQQLIGYEANKVTNMFEIRKYVDDTLNNTIFTRNEQQDCVEFMEALMNCNRSIYDILFSFTESCISYCDNCKKEICIQEERNLVKRLELPSNCEHSIELESLLELNKNKWTSIADYSCQNCNQKGGFKRRHEIIKANDYLQLYYNCHYSILLG
ncbi:uncharacterized protein LOC126907242 [Daktulosphaira vitifoliae]|uniref:uncharacterized protein LOC126907242 n=1 Tax=Daktulosphaira vitifoliae TaxID=58002 RepID=UPI0021AAAAB4|nr:uncharacterized protein LOC126907242 [Daktulosphaira vitifoliae]